MHTMTLRDFASVLAKHMSKYYTSFMRYALVCAP